MEYIDMHSHMTSRTTDCYYQMALTGCVAVSEPGFWMGWDRSSASGFDDYFRSLTDFEPTRAAQYSIKHVTWLCMNPKEADDRKMSRQVLALIPKYLDRPNVMGIGEFGLNLVTRNEVETFKDHVDLALEHNQMMLIHTPHLEDKYKGTRNIVETLLRYDKVDPKRVAIDHAEEHTMDMILTNGFVAGITLYPLTKVSLGRAVDMIEIFGRDHGDRIYVASACDWGPSIPVAMPQFMMEMRRRGHPESLIRKIVFENPVKFLSQSNKFQLPERRNKSSLLAAWSEQPSPATAAKP